MSHILRVHSFLPKAEILHERAGKQAFRKKALHVPYACACRKRCLFEELMDVSTEAVKVGI
jgi:hypothetical protein